MKFRKKPVVIEAITFDELVEHGKVGCSSFSNGMPWSFKYNGHPITHENDDCYLIPIAGLGSLRMGRTDMLVTGVSGELSVCRADLFAETHEAAEGETLESKFRAALARLVGCDGPELVGMAQIISHAPVPEEERQNMLAAINLLIETAPKA